MLFFCLFNFLASPTGMASIRAYAGLKLGTEAHDPRDEGMAALACRPGSFQNVWVVGLSSCPGAGFVISRTKATQNTNHRGFHKLGICLQL